jgi:hypothetical protein
MYLPLQEVLYFRLAEASDIDIVSSMEVCGECLCEWGLFIVLSVLDRHRNERLRKHWGCAGEELPCR